MENSLLDILKKINSDLRQKNFLPFYFAYGEEQYFVSSLENNIKKNFNDATSMNIKVFTNDSFDIDEVIKYTINMPFMNDKKLIIFKDVDIFRMKGLKQNNKKNSNEERLLEAFEKSKDNNIVCVFMSPNEEKEKKGKKDEDNYTKNNKFIELFSKNGIVINSKRLKEEELAKYVVNFFKKAGIDIDKVETAYFIKMVGKDLFNLKNETTKLVSYLGDKKKVERKDIDECVSRNIEDNVFKMIDLINMNKQNEALTLYAEIISEGTKPIALLSFFINNYKDIIVVKDLLEKSKSTKEISEFMKYSDWRVKKLIDATKSTTKENLANKLSKITRLSLDNMHGDINENFLIELLFY